MSNWDKFEKELLSDPEVRAEYERQRPYFMVLNQIIKARQERGITQKKLAEKIGTKQSSIARFESGASNPSLDFMTRIVTALGLTLSVQIK